MLQGLANPNYFRIPPMPETDSTHTRSHVILRMTDLAARCGAGGRRPPGFSFVLAPTRYDAHARLRTRALRTTQVTYVDMGLTGADVPLTAREACHCAATTF